MLRILLLTSALVSLALLIAACDAKNSEPRDGAPEPAVAGQPANIDEGTTPPTAVEFAEADYLPLYNSFATFAKLQDAIITGVVKEVLLPFDPRPGYLGVPAESFQGESARKSGWTPSPEELGRPPARDFTVYAVEVTSAIGVTNLRPGDVVAVLQPGGTYEGVAYQVESDPVMQIGTEYLLFLQEYNGLKEISIDEPWGTTYSAAPYGRFSVKGGTLDVVAPEWLCVPCEAPRAVANLSVPEATGRIDAALKGDIKELQLAPAITPAPASPVPPAPSMQAEPDAWGVRPVGAPSPAVPTPLSVGAD